MLTLTGYLAILSTSQKNTKFQLDIKFHSAQSSNATLWFQKGFHAHPSANKMYLGTVHSSGHGYKVLSLKDVLQVTAASLPPTMATLTGRIADLSTSDQTFHVQFECWDPDAKTTVPISHPVHYDGNYAVKKMLSMMDGWGIEVIGIWEGGKLEMQDFWLTAKESSSSSMQPTVANSSSIADFITSFSPQKPATKKIPIRIESEDEEEEEEEEEEEAKKKPPLANPPVISILLPLLPAVPIQSVNSFSSSLRSLFSCSGLYLVS